MDPTIILRSKQLPIGARVLSDLPMGLKGGRFSNPASPSGTGGSRAEAQRRGGVFDLAMGVGKIVGCPRPLWCFGVVPVLLTRAVAENTSEASSFPARPVPPLSDLCAFARSFHPEPEVLAQRRRGAVAFSNRIRLSKPWMGVAHLIERRSP